MTVLFLALMLPIIYIVGKENLKDFKELFEEKPKNECVIIQFPEIKNYRSAENDNF